MNKQHGDTWHEDTCHVTPNRWTLGTWKAKCHILFMHELGWDGEEGTKKGVLHPNQNEFVGDKERGREKDRKKGKGEERRSSI